MRLKLKIEILRAARNQSRFAYQCGKSEVWISNIVTGRATPTDEDKALIYKQLGVDPHSAKGTELFEIG